jgi:cyanophycinase
VELFHDYVKAFEQIGITGLGHIHYQNRKEVINDDLSERIPNADAFFFSGGDQLKLTGY